MLEATQPYCTNEVFSPFYSKSSLKYNCPARKQRTAIRRTNPCISAVQKLLGGDEEGKAGAMNPREEVLKCASLFKD